MRQDEAIELSSYSQKTKASWDGGAPGTIRTSDPQIRSLTSRVDKTTIFCKRAPLSSMGDQWVSTHIANHFAVCQRDDGMWSLGFHDDAPGPFPSRNFAESVRLRQTRHDPKWCLQ